MVDALVFLNNNQLLLEGKTVSEPAAASVSLFDPHVAGEDEADEEEPIL